MDVKNICFLILVFLILLAAIVVRIDNEKNRPLNNPYNSFVID